MRSLSSLSRASMIALFAALGTAVTVSPIALQAQTPGVRQVADATHAVVPVQTRLRFTTMIVLPDDEEILDVVCGDKDFWVVSATHNLAHVKPAKEGAATNLNLVTASGAVYSFLLNEKGGTSTPDLKVYVNADPDAPHMRTKYYTAAQFEAAEGELAEARKAIDVERKRASELVATYRQEYPSTLQFVYGMPKYDKPFLVRAIWHDGQFTYVKTDASELPALYEIKDGAASLVNFQVRNGTYVVPKIIDRGYLALGKARFAFAQQDR
jgi:type IV secretory pathway VirB9-like protein